MPKLMAPPLPPGCPWSGYTPPNVNWCEEELCSWIVNPAGTWSNLAYVVLGVAMILRTRSRWPGSPVLSLFGPAAVVVGVFSFVYHASYTYLLQFFDFVGMFVFCFTLVAANALRLGQIEVGRRVPLVLGGSLLFSLLVLLLSATTIPIQSLVALLIGAILLQEVAIRRGGGAAGRSGVYLVALALLAVGAAFSAADVTRVFCDPANHWLQGHALWHVFTAASLFVLYFYYEDIESGAQPT